MIINNKDELLDNEKNDDENSIDTDNNDSDLVWEEIKTEHLIQDEWIDFRRSAFRFPDGSEFEPYYSYSRRNYVVIVATDEEGNYICVRQYRYGIKEVTTEFPAGGIEVSDNDDITSREEGNDSDETTSHKDVTNQVEYNLSSNYKVSEDVALEAAVRELQEETGYVSDEWRHLITVASNATIADNYAYIFEAKNCRKVSGLMLDDTEFLNVRKYSAAELEKMVKENKFQQAIHIMAWLYSKNFMSNK